MHVRYARRYPLQCPISFTGDQLVGEGTVLNVSLGGWKVASAQPVHPGSCFALKIALPDQHAPMKIELATVRWATGQEFGLESVHTDPQAKARLSRLISSLEMASPV